MVSLPTPTLFRFLSVGTMADHIPNDLLIDILARLPVASLLRYRSVCKQWYSLITSPSFVTKQLNQSIKNSERNGGKLILRLYDDEIDMKERHLLLNDDDQFGEAYSKLGLTFKLPSAYFRVVSGCNGLLCLVDYDLKDNPEVIIWNPSTRKSVTLPKAPKNCAYGFGAHPATQEYKLIRLEYDWVEWNLKLRPKVKIYTQRTKLWRAINCPSPSYYIYMWSQAFVDGAVHWVAYEPRVRGGVRNLIMLFNMASESFSEFKLPPTLAEQDPKSLSVMTYGQSLVVVCSGQSDSDGCCIWVMKEYGVAESWTKILTSNLLRWPNKTLGFRKNGEVLLASDNSLASYAPGTNTLATTGIRGISCSFYVDPFMETLVL